MNDNDSASSEDRKTNYLELLREIEKLENWSTNSKGTHYVIGETLTMSEMDSTFNHVKENIESISEKMAFQKRTVFIVSIFNTILRLSTIDGFDLIISRTPFQSMFEKVKIFIWNIILNDDLSQTFASDVADLMLMNLTKENFIGKCFDRLLLKKSILNTEIATTQGSVETEEMQNSDTTDEESAEYDRTNFNDMVKLYLLVVHKFLFVSVIRSTHEFKNNYKPLMVVIQTFIDHCLTNTDDELLSTLLGTLEGILNIIVSLTDKIELIPMFMETGYVTKSVEWIRASTFASHINDLGSGIFIIVHNLSRDKLALKQLRKENAVDALMKRKRLVGDKNDNELTRMFRTALISLANSDEQPEQNTEVILDISETLYQLCKVADQDPDLKTEGYHLSECLELLHRAFGNTYVIKHLLENKSHVNPSPIQYFQQLFLSFYGVLLDPEPEALEKRAVVCLLKILFQISSYSEYLREFTNNHQFCIMIESLANRPNLYGAQRIWYNIQQIVSSGVTRKDASSTIYISYDLVDREFCEQFVKELRKRTTMPIWIDYENAESDDNLWEHSDEDHPPATVIIALLSMAYSKNTDKLQELAHATSTNKSIDQNIRLIAVMAEPNFNLTRHWTTDLFCEKFVVRYENNIGNMASKVSQLIAVSKKPLIKCCPCFSRNLRRAAVESSDVTANIGDKSLKPLATTASRPDPVQSYSIMEPTNTADGSNISVSTRKYGSRSIVARLSSQTGSSDYSTWV